MFIGNALNVPYFYAVLKYNMSSIIKFCFAKLRNAVGGGAERA
jgi:hypothetical protein